MKYLAAYALVALSGKTPTADDVKKVLSAGGITADDASVDRLLTAVGSRPLHEIIKEGLGKVSSISIGGGGAPAPTAAAPAPAKDDKKDAKKKEEPKKVEEEEDIGGPIGLFDDF